MAKGAKSHGYKSFQESKNYDIGDGIAGKQKVVFKVFLIAHKEEVLNRFLTKLKFTKKNRLLQGGSL